MNYKEARLLYVLETVPIIPQVQYQILRLCEIVYTSQKNFIQIHQDESII